MIRAGFGIFTQTTLGPMSFNNAGNPTSNLLTNVNASNAANGGTATVPWAFQFPQAGAGSVTLGGDRLEQATIRSSVIRKLTNGTSPSSSRSRPTPWCEPAT